jgi:error-prone DNA polymerase
VIVKRCYNFSSLLKTLTPKNNENLPVLTLAYPDDPDSYREFSAGLNKRSQVREVAPEKIFPEARNFK